MEHNGTTPQPAPKTGMAALTTGFKVWLWIVLQRNV